MKKEEKYDISEKATNVLTRKLREIARELEARNVDVKHVMKEKEVYLPRTQRVTTAVKNYGVGKSTLFSWIKEGKLTAIRPSAGITLLKTDELEKLFNSDEV